MVKENLSGPQDNSIKEIGEMVKNMAPAYGTPKMDNSIKDNGVLENLKDSAPSHHKTEIHMKENSKMGSDMDKEFKNSLMVICTEAVISMENPQVLETITGPMVVTSKDLS